MIHLQQFIIYYFVKIIDLQRVLFTIQMTLKNRDELSLILVLVFRVVIFCMPESSSGFMGDFSSVYKHFPEQAKEKLAVIALALNPLLFYCDFSCRVLHINHEGFTDNRQQTAQHTHSLRSKIVSLKY